MAQHTRRRDSVWEVKTLTRNVPNCMRCMASRALPFPTLHHLIIAWHAQPGRRMLPPVNARAMLAHRRNATFAQSNAKSQRKATGNGGSTDRADTRKQNREHLRAHELVGIGIPRGDSRGCRNREQHQRQRADPRGPPPPPHPLRPAANHLLLDPDLRPASEGGTVSSPMRREAMAAAGAVAVAWAPGDGERDPARVRSGGGGGRARDLGLGFWRARGFVVASARGNEWEELEPGRRGRNSEGGEETFGEGNGEDGGGC